VVANGTPLSVRIRFGSPYSLNSRVKMGLAPSTAVDSRRGRRVQRPLEPGIPVLIAKKKAGAISANASSRRCPGPFNLGM